MWVVELVLGREVDVDGLASVAETVGLAQKVLDNVDGSERVGVVGRGKIDDFLALGGGFLDPFNLTLECQFIKIGRINY